MQFPKKLNVFSQFFSAVLKSTFDFENLEKKKDEPHSFCISAIIDGERSSYVNV